MIKRKRKEAARGMGYVKVFRQMVPLVLAAVLFASMIACSGNLEDKIPGTYDNSFSELYFYSDGTYEDSRSYGTGKWTLLDGNNLKLTDFYGETTTYKIKDVTSEGIVLESGSVWERID